MITIRFSLRQLFLCFTLITCIIAAVVCWTNPARVQYRAVVDIEDSGGSVLYDYYEQPFTFIRNTNGELVNEGSPSFGASKWRDLFHEVTAVELIGEFATDVTMRNLSKLDKVRRVIVWETSIIDLSPLSELKEVEYLIIRYTKPTMVTLPDFRAFAKLQLLVLCNANPIRTNSDIERHDLPEFIEADQLASQLVQLKTLRWLTIVNTSLSEQSIIELRDQMPNCHVVSDSEMGAIGSRPAHTN